MIFISINELNASWSTDRKAVCSLMPYHQTLLLQKLQESTLVLRRTSPKWSTLQLPVMSRTFYEVKMPSNDVCAKLWQTSWKQSFGHSFLMNGCTMNVLSCFWWTEKLFSLMMSHFQINAQPRRRVCRRLARGGRRSQRQAHQSSLIIQRQQHWQRVPAWSWVCKRHGKNGQSQPLQWRDWSHNGQRKKLVFLVFIIFFK